MPLKARYQYSDLPTGEWTRLIRLEPGQKDDRLRCQLLNIDLNTRPVYEAISYVWGEPEFRGSITCDGGLLRITSSLHQVLQRFRFADKPRYLWADAVCINQKHTKELNQQVAMMGKIYSQATNVLIWLGYADSVKARSVARLVREMNDLYDEHTKRRSLQETLELKHDDKNNANRESWEAMSQMMHRPWFHRVWVLQEVGSARKATIHFGDTQIQWKDLMKLFSWLYLRALKNGVSSSPAKFSVGSVLYIWLSYDTSRDTLGVLTAGQMRTPTFLDVLDFARERRSNDRRDHIYAFLDHPSLRPGMSGPIIEPDYSSVVLEVYHDFAVKWLTHSGRAHLLSYVFHGDDSTLYSAYPTFVPRWTKVNPTETLNAASHSNGYNASKSSAFSPRFLEGRSLLVKGFVFDTVVWCSESLDATQSSNDAQRSGFTKIWKHIFEPKQPRPLIYENAYRAFSLTLTAGQLNSTAGKLQPEYLEKHFASFCAYWTGAMQACSDEEIRLPQEMLSIAKHGESEPFERTSSYICHQRKFFITAKGYFGIGPRVLQVDDTCSIFFGAEVPYILRQCEDESFLFLGECYVHGIMHGEAIDMLHDGVLEESSFYVY